MSIIIYDQFAGQDIIVRAQGDGESISLFSAKTDGSVTGYSVQLLQNIKSEGVNITAKMNANYFVMASGMALGVRCGIDEWSVPRQYAWYYYALHKDGSSEVGMDTSFWYTDREVQFACSPAMILLYHGETVNWTSPAAVGTKNGSNTQSMLLRTKSGRFMLAVCKGRLTPLQCRAWALGMEAEDLILMDSGGSTCLESEGELLMGTTREISNAVGFYKKKEEPNMTKQRISGADSDLVDIVQFSPNFTPMTNKKIDRIVIHHTAGVNTAANYLAQFMPSSRKAAPNYVIGVDGKIGQSVPEKHRAWTTSSYTIDSRAVTIEVSNDQAGGSWHVSDLCLQRTIDLCIDICRRNGISRVTFIDGDKEKSVLQMHRWWAATACPGQYLGSMFPYIAEKINAALIDPDEPQGKVMYCVQVGAFTKYQNAVNMRKTLADKGFSGYITKDAASSLYRVQIGAFSVKANASNYALELSTKGFDCYVKEKEITK